MIIFISNLQYMALRLKILKQYIEDQTSVLKILTSEQNRYFAKARESTPVAEKALNNLLSRLLIQETDIKRQKKRK